MTEANGVTSCEIRANPDKDGSCANTASLEDYVDLLKSVRRFPSHVGIIMDGNRRWARQQLAGKGTALLGHEAGCTALKKVIFFMIQLPQIETVTVYAFSTENWKRQPIEVSGIFSLATRVFLKNIDEFAERNIRVRVLGSRVNLPKDLCQAVDSAEEKTADNTGLLLVVALNYGGDWDIAEGLKQFAQIKHTEADLEVLSCGVEAYMPSSFLAPVDLLIRTGGEKRLSNFLPLQVAYAELYFVDTLWPDFTERDFVLALSAFSSRVRRFGADSPALTL